MAEAAASTPTTTESTSTSTATTPATNTPATTESLLPSGDNETTTAPATGRPEWLHEKYKTIEDQAKAYTEMHKMYMEKNEVPEHYAFDDIFKEHGMEIADKAAYDAFEKEFRDLGINSKQANALVARYAREVNAIIQPLQAKITELTPPNLKEERAKLDAEWGNNTQATLDAAGKWARNNLPKTVAEALGRTADGIKFVVGMMNGQKGPVPITDNTGVAALEPGEIQSKIKEIMQDKDYMRNDDKGKALQKQVYNLHKQLRQVQGKPLQ
jgi:polyhydroxyalkanoate synthesis regulator phasin